MFITWKIIGLALMSLEILKQYALCNIIALNDFVMIYAFAEQYNGRLCKYINIHSYGIYYIVGVYVQHKCFLELSQ